MKINCSIKNFVVIVFFSALLFSSSAYVIMLPEMQPSPTLPYVAEADHFSGPACVQMALNSCPTLSGRHLNTQTNIYNSVLAHNAEPTLWFSSPAGLRGALMDPVFSPCGNWVDYSGTDKNSVMGKVLYYLKSMKYLAPVSISKNEHWVNVIGYQTDAEPTTSYSTVTLQYVFFYDPLPGSSALGWVAGSVWFADSNYWGGPIVKPASTTWNGKYLAVIEPPPVTINIKVPVLIERGRILPCERIIEYATKWFTDVSSAEVSKGVFKILQKQQKVETPVLVNASGYSYYLLQLSDKRVAAIFNAYNGSFEELRIAEKPRSSRMLNPDEVIGRFKKEISVINREVGEISKPVLQYDANIGTEGRFSPVWQFQTTIKQPNATGIKKNLIIDMEGKIIKWL